MLPSSARAFSAQPAAPISSKPASAASIASRAERFWRARRRVIPSRRSALARPNGSPASSWSDTASSSSAIARSISPLGCGDEPSAAGDLGRRPAVPELPRVGLPQLEQSQRICWTSDLEQRLDVIGDVDRDRGREARRGGLLGVDLEALESPQRLSGPEVESPEQRQSSATRRHTALRLGVGVSPLGEASGKRHVALERGDPGERHVNGRLVQLATRVLERELARPIRMLSRKR